MEEKINHTSINKLKALMSQNLINAEKNLNKMSAKNLKQNLRIAKRQYKLNSSGMNGSTLTYPIFLDDDKRYISLIKRILVEKNNQKFTFKLFLIKIFP